MGNPLFSDASVTLYPSDRSLAAFDNLFFLIYVVGDTLRNRIKYLSKVFMLTFTSFDISLTLIGYDKLSFIYAMAFTTISGYNVTGLSGAVAS